MWLLDLSDFLPQSARLDGFDIDLSQTPPNEWLPPNVSISKWDVLEEEVPEALKGQYGERRSRTSWREVFTIVRLNMFKILSTFASLSA